MATFAQNIRKIRGEAIYGGEMRTAIADAITQAINVDLDGSNLVTVQVTPIENDDYMLSIDSHESGGES